MNDDDRLHRYLAHRADLIVLPDLEPDTITQRATRRRHRRRGLAAVAIVAAAATTTGVIVTRGSGEKVGVAGEGSIALVDSPLDWNVVEPEVGLGWSRATTISEDGTIYGLSTAPGPFDPYDEEQFSQSTLYRSSDGREWGEVALPDDLYASSLASAGSRLYAVGTAPAGGGGIDLVVAATDDGGESWRATTRLPFARWADLKARFGGQVRVGELTIASGSGGVVAAVVVQAQPNVEALLGDRYNPEWGYSTTAKGVDLFAPMEEPSTRIIVPGTEAESASTTFPAPRRPDVAEHLTWSELNLDPELEALLSGELHVFVSADGESFEEVEVPTDGRASQPKLVATAAGYILFVQDGLYIPTGSEPTTRVFRSTDGRTWAADPAGTMSGYFQSAGLLAGQPAVLLGQFDGGIALAIAQVDGSWTNVDLGGLLGGNSAYADPVAFGPLGMAAVIGSEGEGPQVAYSPDGTTFSLVPMADLVDKAGTIGVSVTADAVFVRVTEQSDGDPATVTPQHVLVGTPKG